MLSVVLATHNEEKNLARCLESIKSIATEIIIVDGASTDTTVAIASRYTNHIIQTTNKANFHINKQMAIDEASQPLVLQLDADEVVDEALVAYISDLLSQLKTSKTKLASAWWIRRKNYFCGRFLRKGGQYPDPVIRLFLRGKARLPMQDVHEQMQVEGEVAWAEGHLLHYSNPTFADYWRKFQTYTSFKAQQLEAKKIKKNSWSLVEYVLWKPIHTFFLIYIRHKGFVDSWQGFLFAYFSGLHHAVAYLKYIGRQV